MHVRQNLHFARIFSPRKKVEVVYILSPLVTGKIQSDFSFLWYSSRHQNNNKKTNKVLNSRNWSLIHFSNIFQWLFETRPWNKLYKCLISQGTGYTILILWEIKMNQWLRRTKLAPPKSQPPPPSPSPHQLHKHHAPQQLKIYKP